jgi:hypothetical protein
MEMEVFFHGRKLASRKRDDLWEKRATSRDKGLGPRRMWDLQVSCREIPQVIFGEQYQFPERLHSQNEVDAKLHG